MPVPAQHHPAENFADNNPATETASHDRNLKLLNPALFFCPILHLAWKLFIAELRGYELVTLILRPNQSLFGESPCLSFDTIPYNSKGNPLEKTDHLQPPVHDGGTTSHSAAASTSCLRGHACVQRVFRTSYAERTLQPRFLECPRRGHGTQFDQCQSHGLNLELDFLDSLRYLLPDRVRQSS